MKWKEKYLASLEDQEKQEKHYLDHLDLLRKGLVRVSLAADGIDQQLDNELHNLRTALRDNQQGSELARLMERVEQHVLKLDNKKKENASAVLSTLIHLIEQLQTLEIPKQVKKQLKDYLKDVRLNAENLREYPRLLTQYAKLQSESLAYTLEQYSQNKTSQQHSQQQITQQKDDNKKGFWEKLIGTDDLNDSAGKIKPLPESPINIQNISIKKEELELSSDESKLPSSELKLPSDDTSKSALVAIEVGQTIFRLIDQIEVPDQVDKQAMNIKQKITQGLHWDDVVPALEDMAVVVLAAVSRGQKDFEEFLESLNDSLLDVQKFLNTTGETQLTAQKEKQSFNTAMRGHVSNMHDSVLDANDLGQLKLSIKEQLDNIASAMDGLKKHDDKFDGVLNEQITVLMQRVESMEEEAQSFRVHFEEQRVQAMRDVLTELPNRQAYEDRMQEELARWQRYGGNLTMAVADVDLFKNVNDTYGHIAGDKVLKIMAKELLMNLRETDFVARYGGEEFVVLLPGTSLGDAELAVNKIRVAIENCPFHFRDKRVSITMSFGVAEFKNNEKPEQVFSRADKALYKAKEQGRNCVVITK